MIDFRLIRDWRQWPLQQVWNHKMEDWLNIHADLAKDRCTFAFRRPFGLYMIIDVPVPLIWENDVLHCKDKLPAQVQDGPKKG